MNSSPALCVLCAGCGVCVAVWMCWCPVSNVSPCWWPHWDRDYFQSVSIHSSGSHQQTPPVIAWSPGHSQAKINYHFISHPSMRWHSTTRNKAWKLLGEREKIITKSGEKLDNSTSEFSYKPMSYNEEWGMVVSACSCPHTLNTTLGDRKFSYQTLHNF